MTRSLPKSSKVRQKVAESQGAADSMLKPTCGDIAAILQQIETLKSKVLRHKPWCAEIVTEAWLETRNDFFHNDGDFIRNLIDKLKDRDEPMTRETLREVFEYGGVAYTDKHIEACKPDSQEAVDEQAAYYENGDIMTNLQKAIIKQLGYEELGDECRQVFEDICKGGADAGFGGFTYYTETVDFFNKHKQEIMQQVEELADDIDQDMLAMIAGFNCLKSMDLTPTQVMGALYEPDHEDEMQVKNALAWFALEEMAHAVVDGGL